MSDFIFHNERIKDRREKLGMSEKELYEKIFPDIKQTDDYKYTRTPYTCVHHWETGKTVPRTRDIPKLCEVLQCEPDYLYGLIDDPTHKTTDICKATGLSENAVLFLDTIKDDSIRDSKDISDFVNAFLVCQIAYPIVNRIVHINVHKDRDYMLLDHFYYGITRLFEKFINDYIDNPKQEWESWRGTNFHGEIPDDNILKLINGQQN